MPNGFLKVQVFQGDSLRPVDNCKVTVTSTGEYAPSMRQSKELITDSSGLTQIIDLEAPPLEYSQSPSDKLPYSFADIKIEAKGFETVEIKGAQIFPEIVALQTFNLQENSGATRQIERTIIVDPNTLVGNFPPKIPEDPDKPLPKPPEGEVVLPKPVVPEFIVVHLGRPEDNSAKNVTVRFRDYIKNVACCEIFSTWPENTIRANVYCILSFTLNRVYTEWYKSKGKDFTITNSTAFDHAFSDGRNIYQNISRIVDDIFTSYIKRYGAKQPLLTQYCDGVRVKCPGWLTQWGSKYLGDQGKVPFDILTHFYGKDIDLVQAEKVKGIPLSWPGYDLVLGSKGEPVRVTQTYLNRISQNYPAIPKTAVDGVFGPKTKAAVSEFQRIFSLPVTGIVDFATWYKISSVYVGVTKIAELRSGVPTNIIDRTFVPPMPFESYIGRGVPSVHYWDEE